MAAANNESHLITGSVCFIAADRHGQAAEKRGTLGKLRS